MTVQNPFQRFDCPRLAPLVSDGVGHLPAFSGGRADPLSLVQQQQEKEREEVDYTSI